MRGERFKRDLRSNFFRVVRYFGLNLQLALYPMGSYLLDQASMWDLARDFTEALVNHIIYTTVINRNMLALNFHYTTFKRFPFPNVDLLTCNCSQSVYQILSKDTTITICGYVLFHWYDRSGRGGGTMVYSQEGIAQGVLNIDSGPHEVSWLQ
eukprot:g38877.t1